MSLNQSLQQKLLQKLSPQQIQLMKLLQVPTAILDDRIKEELEENPALELTEDGYDENFDDGMKDEFAESESGDDYEESSTDDTYENIDISDYVSEGDDDIADYKLRDDNYGEQEEKQTMPYKVETSFYEVLEAQLGMLKLDETQFRVAEQIIGSIDEDGYLRRETSAIVDDLAFRQNIFITEEEVETLIKRIQHFDPPGVAARNLQECLLLQLNRHKDEGKEVDTAIAAITRYFDEFTKKHYEKIQRGLNLTDDELKDVMQQITRLNPKPGGTVSEMNKAESYVVPDFFIFNNAGKLELTLNSKNAPELRISEGYRDMLREYERLLLLEDACQSIGGSYKGQYLGTIGDAGTFSFDFVKTITCGEGGVVMTNREDVYINSDAFSDHGHDHKGADRGADLHPYLGYNFRISELHAAVGLAQVRRLPDFLAMQRRNATQLKSLLAQIPGITFRRLPDEEGDSCSFVSWFLPSEEATRTVVDALRSEGALAGSFYWFDNNWHYIRKWDHLKGATTHNRLSEVQQAGLLKLQHQDFSLSDAVMSRCVSTSISLLWTEEQIAEKGAKMVAVATKALQASKALI